MNKPVKPYPTFPLFPDNRGQWRKDVRVNGGKPRPFYFGTWADDPKGERAVAEWLRREPAIRAGLDHITATRGQEGEPVVAYLKRFLSAKQAELLAGDISDETFNDYIATVNAFGAWVGPTPYVSALTPDVFAAYRKHLEGKGLGPNRLANTIKYIKAAFNYGGKQGWIVTPAYGMAFDPPATDPDSKAMAAMRKGDSGERDMVYTGAQAEWFIARATPTIRACILLSLNCGIGPSDLSKLTWRHIKGKRLSMRRGKTGIRREAYLWKRTREALEAVKLEPHSAAAISRDGDKASCFFTTTGNPLVSRTRIMDGDRVKAARIVNSLSITFSRWMAQARKQGAVPADSRLTYYNFRHTYYSHAEDQGDSNAVYRTVGHTLQGQGRVYKQKPFPLPRLKKVALFAKRRIWPKAKAPNPTGKVQPGQLRLTA